MIVVQTHRKHPHLKLSEVSYYRYKHEFYFMYNEFKILFMASTRIKAMELNFFL